jgi:hypothetical protein
MTETIAALLAALALCTTDTQCEAIAAGLCSAGETQYCENSEETTK